MKKFASVFTLLIMICLLLCSCTKVPTVEVIKEDYKDCTIVRKNYAFNGCVEDLGERSYDKIKEYLVSSLDLTNLEFGTFESGYYKGVSTDMYAMCVVSVPVAMKFSDGRVVNDTVYSYFLLEKTYYQHIYMESTLSSVLYEVYDGNAPYEFAKDLFDAYLKHPENFTEIK